MNFSLLGNLLRFFYLSLTVLYAIAVVGHSLDWWILDNFGKNWAADGFCLSFKATLYHTHLLCLYADSILALVLLVLSQTIQGRSELKVVKENVASVFFHGLAHGFLWWKGAEDIGNPSLIAYVVLAGFYFSFTHLMTPSPLWLSLLQTVFHTYVTTLIPPIMIFAYVNLVITFNLSIAQILTAPRDIFYLLNTLLIGTPIIIATFVEPLFCDSLLINYGGHIIFDVSIPLGVILYYIVVIQMSPREDVGDGAKEKKAL
jgi:hypothetical protein